MISHTGIKITADLLPSVTEWYTKALAPLGYKKTRSFYGGLASGFSDHPQVGEAANRSTSCLGTSASAPALIDLSGGGTS